MEFQKLTNRAMDLRQQYEKKEIQLYGSPATNEDLVQGLSGDAHNLLKLVMAEHGKREIANSKEKLEAHLAHCLWSVIVLAKLQDIDVEQAFMRAMDRLESHLLDTPG